MGAAIQRLECLWRGMLVWQYGFPIAMSVCTCSGLKLHSSVQLLNRPADGCDCVSIVSELVTWAARLVWWVQ